MPACSDELARRRRDEIISACAGLYDTMSFKDITLKEIGERTSFTRTSIYNYFHTKDEIFLALFRREYECWAADLDALAEGGGASGAAGFADALARTVERRGRLLKLMSVNLYDMEGNSPLESLVAFKRSYAACLAALERCLYSFFPGMGEEDARGFIYAFLPFLFGVYPYTVLTDKQREAMELAGVDYPELSVYGLTRSFVLRLLGRGDG